MKNTKEKKYPATVVAHWATGPVPCCNIHANGLVNLGRFMGTHVAVTVNEDTDAQCENCINASKES
jgi:hypothetical protein